MLHLNQLMLKIPIQIFLFFILDRRFSIYALFHVLSIAYLLVCFRCLLALPIFLKAGSGNPAKTLPKIRAKSHFHLPNY